MSKLWKDWFLYCETTQPVKIRSIWLFKIWNIMYTKSVYMMLLLVCDHSLKGYINAYYCSWFRLVSRTITVFLTKVWNKDIEQNWVSLVQTHNCSYCQDMFELHFIKVIGQFSVLLNCNLHHLTNARYKFFHTGLMTAGLNFAFFWKIFSVF